MQNKALFNRISRNRLAVITVMAALNVLLITFLISPQAVSSVEALGYTSGTLQSSVVSVAPQINTPLRITVESIDDSTPLAPQINYAVQNISDKPIRAYTVLEETATNSARSRYSSIVNLTSTAQILQPYQSKRDTFGGESFKEPLVSLVLSIDFVEFADGTTWSKDTQQAAENIAGQRAGGREASKKLRELLGKQGVEAIVNLVKQKNIEIVAPSADRSEAWQHGFRIGHNTVLHRLKVAHEKGGLTQFTSELQKPFDASEGRQEK